LASRIRTGWFTSFILRSFPSESGCLPNRGSKKGHPRKIPGMALLLLSCLCQDLRGTAQLLGDVQHMVAHALEVGEDLGIEDAALVGALAVLHAAHVVFPETTCHVVDGLLQFGSIVQPGLTVQV